MEFQLRDCIDDQYKVIEKHRGGMSVVYVVLDEFSQRRFAVKTLKEELLADREAVSRFSREAKTWLNLGRHPNIVEAIIYREIDRQPFLFLDYVAGTDLQKLFEAEKRLFSPQLLKFAQQICAGMEYIHNLPIGPTERGVVHRDLKPSNLMLTRQANIKISDFGLAKVRGTGIHLTDTGQGLGTYLYMPPEQFTDAASADRTSDLYSVGVVMYVAITGQPPLQGGNVGALIRSILSDEPVHPAKLVPNIPEQLDEIIMRCLAKNRADRYQTFSELSRALSDVERSVHETVAGQSVVKCTQCGFMTWRRYSTCPICIAPMQRIKYNSSDQPDSQSDADTSSPDAVRGKSVVVDPVQTDEDNPTVAAAEMLYRRASKWQQEGDLRRAIALFRQVLAVDAEHDRARQSLDAAALELVRQRSKKTTRVYNWPMFRGNITRTGYTPEVVLPPLQLRWRKRIGQWVIASPVVANGVVFIGAGIDQGIDAGRISALVASTGEVLWEKTFNHELLHGGCVLNGKAAFFAVHNRIVALDAGSGDKLWQVEARDRVSTSPVAWQNTVYYGTDDGSLVAASARTGRTIWEFSAELGISSSPLVWRDKVYVGSLDHRLYTLDATSGRELWQFMTGGEIYSSPAFHKGRLYVCSADQRLYCLDPLKGRRVWEFQTQGQIDSSPGAWQSLIYVGSRDRRVYAVDATTGAHVWNFEAGDWVNSSPAISGRTVYVGCHDQNLYALETLTGVCLWQHQTDGHIQSSPAVSGQSVYVASNDGYLYAFKSRSI